MNSEEKNRSEGIIRYLPRQKGLFCRPLYSLLLCHNNKLRRADE